MPQEALFALPVLQNYSLSDLHIFNTYKMIHNLSHFLLELIKIFDGHNIAPFEQCYIREIYKSSIQFSNAHPQQDWPTQLNNLLDAAEYSTLCVNKVDALPNFTRYVFAQRKVQRLLENHIQDYFAGYIGLDEIQKRLCQFTNTHFDHNIHSHTPWELPSILTLADTVIEQIIRSTEFLFIPMLPTVENV